MTKSVSIVIPVYNGEKFIADAIESALKQTLSPHEIIVVNDGSTDETSKVLARYESYISVINIPNGGVANARNVGIQACSGYYISFLDADDIWHQNKLEVQIKAMDMFPDAVFSCSNFDRIDSFGRRKNHFLSLKNSKDFIYENVVEISAFELLISFNFVGTCSNVIIKKCALSEVGLFDQQYKQSEDLDLWLKLSTKSKFLIVPCVLIEKRKHETNLTNNLLETLIYHELVLLNLSKSINYRGYFELYDSKFKLELASLCYEIAILYYKSGNRLMTLRYILAGFQSNSSLSTLLSFIHLSGKRYIRNVLSKESNAVM